jgi:hypothetical protein
MAETLSVMRRHERTLAELKQRTSEHIRLLEIRRLREGLGMPLKPLTIPSRPEPAATPGGPPRSRAVNASLRGAP